MAPLSGRIGLAGTRFSPAVKLMFSPRPIPPGGHAMGPPAAAPASHVQLASQAHAAREASRQAN